MHILSVYAHPDPNSFNNALTTVIGEEIEHKGHSHVFRDLYKEGFNPVLTARDFEDFNHGSIPEDIKTEQELVTQADILIFIHPIWWFGIPAILKGWIDKVFSYGFAYSHDSRGVRPLLTGKKAIIVNTTGGDEKYGYAENGARDAILLLTDKGIYNFTGLDVLLHRFFNQVPIATQEDRLEMLNVMRSDLRKIL